MDFCHKAVYGKDLFYPSNNDAKRFVEAFPSSGGKRKSLTKNQLAVLKDAGIQLVITENLNPQKEHNNVTSRNEGL